MWSLKYSPKMEATLLAILLLIKYSTCSIISGGGTSPGGTTTGNSGVQSSYYSESIFRNLDTQLLRIGSRLDQLMLRMDHLDSRVGRVQSNGHVRFDSIETSMQTTRQRVDLWSNQLNLFEEQLTRKWKNMESRFESLVSTIDSKLDTKFNLVQRDNRRHNEYISQAFNNVVISQEKLADKVTLGFNEVNSTLKQTHTVLQNTTSSTKSHSSTCLSRLDNFLQNLTTNNYPAYQSPSSTTQQHRIRSNNAIQPDQLFYSPSRYSSTSFNSNSANASTQLVSSKVSNMFDELVKRSHDLEAIVKDTFTMSNLTRREIQDGFMALIPIVSQVGFRNEKEGGSSGEVMSAMVLEAVSTMETVSSSLTRKMSEMRNSINERFDIVSMTLNGFLESCLRIQDKTPQLEETIGDVLWRIMDSVDNSTRNATETWQKVKSELAKERTNCSVLSTNLSNLHEDSSEDPDPNPDHLAFETDHEGNEHNEQHPTHDNELLQGLTEDQKHVIWESITRLAGQQEYHVPE